MKKYMNDQLGPYKEDLFLCWSHLVHPSVYLAHMCTIGTRKKWNVDVGFPAGRLLRGGDLGPYGGARDQLPPTLKLHIF